LKLSLVGVYVPGVTARATEADTATNTADNVVMIPTRFMFCVFLTSRVCKV
jgi:hypothetical protein